MSVVSESDVFLVNFSSVGKVRLILSLQIGAHSCPFILHLEIVGSEFGKTTKNRPNMLTRNFSTHFLDPPAWCDGTLLDLLAQAEVGRHVRSCRPGKGGGGRRRSAERPGRFAMRFLSRRAHVLTVLLTAVAPVLLAHKGDKR